MNGTKFLVVVEAVCPSVLGPKLLFCSLCSRVGLYLLYCLLTIRLEESEQMRQQTKEESRRLEQTLVAEREKRLQLEEQLTQVQEQLKLQEYTNSKEVLLMHSIQLGYSELRAPIPADGTTNNETYAVPDEHWYRR